MLRIALSVFVIATGSLDRCQGQNPPADAAKREKEKLVEVCRSAWRQTTAVPKGLKAEGTFSTFLNGNEDTRATFAFTAKGERYRADMTFEAGNHPRPGTKMVVLRDPGVVFSATTTLAMGPNGPVPLVRGDVWDEQTAVRPPVMTFLPTSPFRAVHTINLETMKLEHIVAAKTLGNGDIELLFDTDRVHVKIVCAKDQGHNVTLTEVYREKLGGPVAQRETVKWKSSAGTWCPEEITWRSGMWKDGKLDRTAETRLKYTKFDPKADIGAGVLSLDDLGLPDKTRIQDRRRTAPVRERRYLQGDGSDRPLEKVIEDLPVGPMRPAGNGPK
jgi:hypothetical protein